ncbi:MAG: thrombospondin type 3 repeat-containing protein, partial [Phycisphaerae bacterium]
PSVVETDIQLPGEGLFILAAKAIDLGNDVWRYEYAIENLNSDCSGGSFSVPLPPGAVVSAFGFHDVDHHSGEPYDGTDWSVTTANLAITWSTEDATVNPNANALRWGTLYNFWFEVNQAPHLGTATLGTFKPGCVESILAQTVVPTLDLIDCNTNMIADACDIDCAALGCTAPCGQIPDCNSNGVPDDCEPDCNGNMTADTCDVSGGTSPDCDGNLVPDECQPDCDGDGIPDACDDPVDTDGDGIFDCDDLCPTTSPAGSCRCPPMGPGFDACCFLPNDPTCWTVFTRNECLSLNGTPDCVDSPCRDGCLMGDFDRDGDLDLPDVGAFFRCFAPSGSGSAMPECLLRFDFEDDGDVDLIDYQQWYAAGSKGPKP